MTPVKIEKGVPTPGEQRGRKPIYPWEELKVGDSFVAKKTVESFRPMASRAAKRYRRKFKVSENPKGGVRVWRVA